MKKGGSQGLPAPRFKISCSESCSLSPLSCHCRAACSTVKAEQGSFQETRCRSALNNMCRQAPSSLMVTHFDDCQCGHDGHVRGCASYFVVARKPAKHWRRQRPSREPRYTWAMLGGKSRYSSWRRSSAIYGNQSHAALMNFRVTSICTQASWRCGPRSRRVAWRVLCALFRNLTWLLRRLSSAPFLSMFVTSSAFTAERHEGDVQASIWGDDVTGRLLGNCMLNMLESSVEPGSDGRCTLRDTPYRSKNIRENAR